MIVVTLSRGKGADRRLRLQSTEAVNMGSDEAAYYVYLHLESGEVEITPYRTYAEAQCVAALLLPFAGESTQFPRPRYVPFVYVFPPDAPISRVEVRGPMAGQIEFAAVRAKLPG